MIHGNLLRRLNRRLFRYCSRRHTLRAYSKPFDATFEMSSRCNLRCVFCNTGGLRDSFSHVQRGNMAFDTFKVGVDKLLPQLEHLTLYAWGEPFLNADLFRCIHYAHVNHVTTQLSTNMNLYTEALGRRLVEAGLDNLVVSCDGLTQETYERYRVGGRLPNVVEGVDNLVGLRRSRRSAAPRIEMQFIVFRHNEHEMEEYKRYWLGKGVDTVSFIRMSFLSGKGEEVARANGFVPENPDFQPLRPYGSVQRCWFLYGHVTINYNGDWYTCCYPCGQTSYRIANIAEDEFWSVWNGDYYRYCRGLFRNRAPGSDGYETICHDCSGRLPQHCRRHYWAVPTQRADCP